MKFFVSSTFIAPFAVYFLVGYSPVWAQSSCKENFSAPASSIELAYHNLLSEGHEPKEGQRPPERWGVDGLFDSLFSYRLSLGRAIDLLRTGAKTYEQMLELENRGLIYNFKDTYFQNLVDRSNTSTGKSDVLDLFGSGFFTYELTNVSSVTSVRLGPIDPQASVMPENWRPSSNHKELYGFIQP